MLYLLTVLKIIHNNIIIFFKSYYKVLNLIKFFIICILAVRYNLIQSIHNFINANDFNQFLKYALIITTIFILFLLKNINKKIFKLKINNIKNYDLLVNMNKILYAFIILLVIYDYIKLKNNFIILLFVSFYYIIIFFVTYLLVLRKNYKISKIKFIFNIIGEIFIFINLFKLIIGINKFKLLHFTVIVFLMICLNKLINVVYVFQYDVVKNYIKNLNILDFILFNYEDDALFLHNNQSPLTLKKFNQSFDDLFIFSDEIITQNVKIIMNNLK